ncbi:DNA-binding domain-containing protein [Companilactobacillus jidongensis]|uniref:DNA-binding domain-containing protein n=1 Tax=Companilactobacillus jidongensis TaxID=2486006 RepID=UPI000F77DC9B|nr:DNA-binding domain-containing protein [Companilactobacillus jidongensis]
MNFYIVDDDKSITMILHRIIDKNMNNNVVGISTDAKKALSEIMLLDVDIVIVDLLMPHISGIDLIKKLKASKNSLKFIMISQVRDNDLREQAYEAGIEFFIDKPINMIEVKTVVEKVTQNIQMERKLSSIQSLIGGNAPSAPIDDGHKQKEKVRSILTYLGISSEKGASDIMSLCQIMTTKKISFSEVNLADEYNINEQERKVLLQRIRRSVKTGLTNLANISIDNLGDEIVVEYSNMLYEYRNVRNEMQFLEGNRSAGGKVSLQKFFDGLVEESKN